MLIESLGGAMPPQMLAASVSGLLIFLLALAAWSDLRSWRIPNRLVGAGLVLAFGAHILLPVGHGFLSAQPGSQGAFAALQGAVLGLVLFLPFYLMRAMGAGDVKLLAMVGAFVGPQDVLGVALATMLAGGGLTLLAALRPGVARQLWQNLYAMLCQLAVRLAARRAPVIEAAPTTAARLPYGVAIALGTVGYLGVRLSSLGLL